MFYKPNQPTLSLFMFVSAIYEAFEKEPTMLYPNSTGLFQKEREILVKEGWQQLGNDNLKLTSPKKFFHVTLEKFEENGPLTYTESEGPYHIVEWNNWNASILLLTEWPEEWINCKRDLYLELYQSRTPSWTDELPGPEVVRLNCYHKSIGRQMFNRNMTSTKMPPNDPAFSPEREYLQEFFNALPKAFLAYVLNNHDLPNNTKEGDLRQAVQRSQVLQ